MARQQGPELPSCHRESEARLCTLCRINSMHGRHPVGVVDSGPTLLEPNRHRSEHGRVVWTLQQRLRHVLCDPARLSDGTVHHFLCCHGLDHQGRR